MLVGCMHALPSTEHRSSTCDKYTTEIVKQTKESVWDNHSILKQGYL